MALGDQAGKAAVDDFVAAAPGLIDRLQSAGMTVEADIVQRLHVAMTDETSQLAAVIKGMEDPLLARLDSATAVGATLVGLMQTIVDRGLMLSLAPAQK